VINDSAGDAEARRARILVNRVDGFEFGWQHVFTGSEIECVKSFAMAPAVIAAFFDHIDLLIEILAHISREEPSCLRIES
jgi:hypothetical protein